MLSTHERGGPDCRPLLADADDLTLVFQPIVDLATARVAGYQALPRFPGTAGPGVWAAAAVDAGLAAELTALVIHRALAAVADLPERAFLSVDADPALLGAAPVRDVLASCPDLSRLVVQLTPGGPVRDVATLRRQCDDLRQRGALVALDDARTGHAGLLQLAAVRPQVVRLDRALFGQADPVQVALAGMLAEFAGRIDAWLLGDGLETPADLTALARLGVPLAQGWLLGRPTPTFEPLAADVVALVRAQVARARPDDRVARLLRPVRQVETTGAPGLPPAVVVDAAGAPVALLLADSRTAQVHRAPVSLLVPPTADVDTTLQQALRRAPAQRFDPVVCTDPAGAVLGLLRIEDLTAAHLDGR